MNYVTDSSLALHKRSPCFDNVMHYITHVDIHFTRTWQFDTHAYTWPQKLQQWSPNIFQIIFHLHSFTSVFYFHIACFMPCSMLYYTWQICCSTIFLNMAKRLTRAQSCNLPLLFSADRTRPKTVKKKHMDEICRPVECPHHRQNEERPHRHIWDRSLCREKKEEFYSLASTHLLFNSNKNDVIFQHAQCRNMSISHAFLRHVVCIPKSINSARQFVKSYVSHDRNQPTSSLKIYRKPLNKLHRLENTYKISSNQRILIKTHLLFMCMQS